MRKRPGKGKGTLKGFELMGPVTPRRGIGLGVSLPGDGRKGNRRVNRSNMGKRQFQRTLVAALAGTGNDEERKFH